MCQETKLTKDVFEQLAEALDRLPNGFPRTPSGVEIQILKRIFSPDEAALAGQLSGTPEALDEVSARLGLPAGEARKGLFKLARRGGDHEAAACPEPRGPGPTGREDRMGAAV